MEEKKIERINDLYNKSKSQDLSALEKEEQIKLRKEYIDAVKGNLRGQLENISIVNPDGSITDVKDRKK